MGKAGCSSWLLDTHAWQIVLTATGKKTGAAEKGVAKRGGGVCKAVGILLRTSIFHSIFLVIIFALTFLACSSLRMWAEFRQGELRKERFAFQHFAWLLSGQRFYYTVF